MRLSSNQGAHMRLLSSSVQRRRGITVLGLAILIIVVVVLVIFLVRYLGQHPATTSFLNRPVALTVTAASG
jgi:heme/copper-type cytochrome/quinol oxidase subunit 2